MFARTARPHPERELILLSAGTATRRQEVRERAKALTTQVNWQHLSETLRSRKLLPTLGPRILELGRGSPDDSFADTVEQAVTAARRHGAFLELVALDIIASLAKAGMPCTPLKGPLLAEAIYGDPGRRLSSDIDLLVAAEQIDAAVAVIRDALGYEAPADLIDARGLPLLHFALVHREGELPPVELHWRMHWYEERFARERLLRPADDCSSTRHPDLASELAALLLFYARDGFIDLRLAADLSAWWDVNGSRLQRGALDEILIGFPSLARAIGAALEVAERVVGLPTAEIIEGSPVRGVRVRAAVRMANPNPRASAAQLYADMGLVDGLLMPRGGSRAFVRRQFLMPSRERIGRAHGSSERRLRTALEYGGRVLVRCGVVGRYGITMARLVRSPEWNLGQARRLDRATATRSRVQRADTRQRPMAIHTANREPAPSLPVCVIIPAYNRAHLLSRALASVWAQRPQLPAEVIVVDDGSADDTSEVAAAMGARVIRHPHNRGLSAARNTGLNATSQPWAALLDSDDEWLPHHLAHLWTLRGNHALVASSCLRCGLDPSGDRVHGSMTSRPLTLQSGDQLIYPENPIPVSASMVRRDVAVAAGGFQDRHGVVEDLDLWLRVLERHSGICSPQVGVIYHVHGEQMSSEGPRMRRGHREAAEAHRQRTSGSQGTLRRWEGVAAWGRLREALALEEQRDVVRTTLFILRSPHRLRGAARIVTIRCRSWRRARALHAAGMQPSKRGSPNSSA